MAGLLAFPPVDFFWNKVFEIWLLREVARSLERLGCMLVSGPRPLHKRDKGPIYEFRHERETVNVLFQKQAPLGTPRWRYQKAEGEETNLSGIPDVVISSVSRSPFVADAKFRVVDSGTRPEETYKMLGYAENFREAFELSGFHGLLAFIGPR